jgi:anti-anti-sigma factor
MFKITLNEQDGKIVATLIGDLDNVASPEAARGFEPVFERTDCNVLIDCTELNYISSSGLRILLNLYKHTHANHHWVTLKGMSEDIREVFVLGGFLQLFLTED